MPPFRKISPNSSGTFCTFVTYNGGVTLSDDHYCCKELYSVKGINHLYDSNARTYTTDIARFMLPDPKAHDYHRLSPYAYCGGDPINHIDPDGKVPVPIVMALIGACMDFTTQVSINLVQGKSFWEAVGNVDMTSVVASAATSAILGPGASKLTKAVATSISAADAVVDVKIDGTIRYVGGENASEKPVAEVVIDFGTSWLTDIGIKYVSSQGTSATSTITETGVKELTKDEMDRATKIIFKISAEGAKEIPKRKKRLKAINNTEPTDAIKPNNVNPPIKPIEYEKIY